MKIDIINTCFNCSQRFFQDTTMRTLWCSKLGRAIDKGEIPKDCPLPDAKEPTNAADPDSQGIIEIDEDGKSSKSISGIKRDPGR